MERETGIQRSPGLLARLHVGWIPEKFVRICEVGRSGGKDWCGDILEDVPGSEEGQIGGHNRYGDVLQEILGSEEGQSEWILNSENKKRENRRTKRLPRQKGHRSQILEPCRRCVKSCCRGVLWHGFECFISLQFRTPRLRNRTLGESNELAVRKQWRSARGVN